MADDGTHHIGEVAEAVGLSLRTIRHYGEVGVAPPSGRTSGGFRLYTDADIERLRFVKRLKPLSFSLDEVRQLLETRDRLAEGVDDDVERQHLTERIAMFAALADERCEQLRAQLASAREACEVLGREAAAPRGPARHGR